MDFWVKSSSIGCSTSIEKNLPSWICSRRQKRTSKFLHGGGHDHPIEICGGTLCRLPFAGSQKVNGNSLNAYIRPVQEVVGPLGNMRLPPRVISEYPGLFRLPLGFSIEAISSVRLFLHFRECFNQSLITSIQSLLSQIVSVAYFSPLKSSDCSVDRSGQKRCPGRSFYRFLYAVLAVLTGGFLSYRLLVLGDDLFKTEPLNILVLFGSFLICAYGFVLLLTSTMLIDCTN